MEKCRYKDRAGYCKNRRNQERGGIQMKCFKNGCPYISEKKMKFEINMPEKDAF